MSIKVLPLKGYKALKALNAFNVLLLGLKMLPAYITEDYVSFFEKFKEKTDAEKETFLREAVAFVTLAQDEIEALVSFATDKNGIPYSKENLKNILVDELYEIIVAVGMEIGRIKIDLVSEDEKKKYEDSALTLDASS